MDERDFSLKLVTGEFPTQKASNAEMFPFDDVIMIWLHVLLPWGVNKMTKVLHTTFSTAFLNKIKYTLIGISLNIVPEGPNCE